MDKVIENWDKILQTVKADYDVGDVAFNTWLKPLKVYDVRDHVITILVPSEQVVLINLLNKKYKLLLQVTICEITGMEECEVKFISPDEAPKKEVSSYDNASASTAMSDIDRRCEEAHLNPKYIFDTFIVGNNNKFAQAAALAVAESPGDTYNPLFIYGGAGLGKTHLMHSIAHYIIEHDENSKVLYVTSEEFTNELIETIRNGNNSAMSKFREKYRNIDVLLVDDIQFIIGKESTQEEFFHTFNELHEAKKQIVISSDKHPREIATLEERLRSRFEWGITADIQPPDYETKMAILNKRAELEHLKIDPKVMEYVATNINSNIRELEGALNKICVFANLEKKPITLELAEQALKDTIETQHEITPQLIMEVVAQHFNITVSDILSKKKNKEIANPRQICMYLCRKYTDYSLQALGKVMGNRDHSTILHGHEKIQTLISAGKDDGLKTTVDILVKKLNPPT